MFRTMSGFKSQQMDLTVLVISEFNEWRVLVHGPGAIVHGTRQFTEEKAKEHAIAVAREYAHDRKHEDLPEAAQWQWTPTTEDDWLVWR
jgi:hypothetical protein